MQPPPAIPPPPPPPAPLQLTPHGPIGIEGDANFTDTALLESWPGDGSPENPYIIEGLEIDLGSKPGHCIWIRNTRVSFIISNCNLTGAVAGGGFEGVGILLENVTYGELVNNNCSSNLDTGILLLGSLSNTVANNTCSSNNIGIAIESWFENSDSNTVENNICNNNEVGIGLHAAHGYSVFNCTVSNNTCSNNDECGIRIDAYHGTVSNNTVVNNTCTSNGESGISLSSSEFNTVANNTCNYNSDYGIRVGAAVGMGTGESSNNTVVNNSCNYNRVGIYIYFLGSNTVANNTCLGNTEHDIIEESYAGELAAKEYVAREFVWFLAGAGMILVVSVIALTQFRRMG
jgi:parallel beta-helix repeat protein